MPDVAEIDETWSQIQSVYPAQAKGPGTYLCQFSVGELFERDSWKSRKLFRVTRGARNDPGNDECRIPLKTTAKALGGHILDFLVGYLAYHDRTSVSRAFRVWFATNVPGTPPTSHRDGCFYGTCRPAEVKTAMKSRVRLRANFDSLYIDNFDGKSFVVLSVGADPVCPLVIEIR